MASFKCKDMGMKCGFEVKDENEDEMKEVIALQARKSHNITEFSTDMMEKVKKAIKK